MVIGHEFVGTVVEAGDAVTSLRVGDLVASGAGVWCGSCRWCRAGRTNLCERYYTLGLNTHGGLAEQVRVPAKTCRVVPDGLDPIAAALAQPVAVALHAVRRAGVASGDLVAVVGTGGIGSLIVAAAAFLGIDRIIAIDVTADRLATAKRLGATQTLDAGSTDMVAGIKDLSDGAGVDVVIEASGAPTAPQLSLEATRRGGTVLMVGLQAAPRPIDLHAMTIREVNVHTTNAHVCEVDLPDALRLLSTSDLADVVVEQVITLDNLVHEGLEPLATGNARGKTLVDLRAT
jgi:threonine dehydrogenase-like Zn-dependent dehydrogenase